MPIITQVICDGCGAVKREVNHWYALTTNDHNANLEPLDIALQNTSTPPMTGNQKIFCGRLCVMEALGHWMETVHSHTPFNLEGIGTAWHQHSLLGRSRATDHCDRPHEQREG
jgi:hypothetical protein